MAQTSSAISLVTRTQATPTLYNNLVTDITELYTDISVKVYHDAAQSIPDSTETALAFNSELYDTDTMHDTVTANTKITIVTPGKYNLIGYAVFNTNETGNRWLTLCINGTRHVGQSRVGAVSGDFTILNATAEELMAAGDYVELTVYQNSGGALNVLNYTDETPTMSARLVAREPLV